MASISFQGPIPPVITPFTARGALDLGAFEANLLRWMEAGIQDMLLFGSNGETPLLETSEKEKLLERAVSTCAGRARVLAGTGLESTRGTIELTRRAAGAGAAAALVITPHFYRSRMDDAALRRHFRSVADASPVPILLYNVPKYTGINLSTSLLRDLSRHDNIIGMKDSSGDIAQFVRYQAAATDGFQVLPGTASIWYPALVLGAEAGIMALANCAPEPCLEVYRLFKREQWEEAEYLYRRLLPLNTAVTATYGIAGLKFACELRGYQAGKVRAPLLELQAEEQQVLSKLFQAAALT